MSQTERHSLPKESTSASGWQSLAVDKTGLIITPSKNSSHTDFDFHVGRWQIHNKKLKAIFQNSDEWVEFESTCETDKILHGFGNLNQYRFQDKALRFNDAIVLRLFNPKSRLWTIHWVESNSVLLDVPVIGSFEGKVGTFFSKEILNGRPIIVRAIYDASKPDEVVWSQAFSPDAGETFETNWIMTAHRQR